MKIPRIFSASSSLFSTLTRAGDRHSQQKYALYRRISRAGDPTVSIVPILDQWIDEGRTVNQKELLFIIKELRSYRCYMHALQVSKWMTNARYFHLTNSDAAIRLDLISKVYGIEDAEDYFNNTPKHLKGLELYGTLLNCYAEARSVDKGETVDVCRIRQK